MAFSNVLVTLIVASIGISRIQSRPTFDAQWVEYKNVKNNTNNTGANDRNMHGSVTQEMTEVYDSPDSHQPSSTQTRTVMASGSPGHEGMSYARSEEHNYQERPNQNQIPINIVGSTFQSGNTYNDEPGSQVMYGSPTAYINQRLKIGGVINPSQLNNIQMPSNGGGIHYGSFTSQTNNSYKTSRGSKNFFGSFTHQEGNQYDFDPKTQTARNNMASQAYSAKHKTPNGQTSLSSDNFYLFLYFLIILLNYDLF